jgi:hypothetical protein
MKKSFVLIASVLFSFMLQAQSPAGFSYQAAVRDNAGSILSSQAVSFRLSVLQGSVSGGTSYQETQTVTTNSLGLVTLVVGTGTVSAGNFSAINWGNGPYFLQVELAIGNAAFQLMGTSQMMSVPYALYAATAGSAPAPSYYELKSFNQVSSTVRNAMVLSTDSLIVPETGNYLIIYTGKGVNQNGYDSNTGIYDYDGETGVINVSQNLNWLGQANATMYTKYQLVTSTASYVYLSDTYSVSTYASLNAGDVLKAGAVAFATTPAPTTSWYFTPYRIQLIKVK